MRILHTSDWHLGVTLAGSNLLPDQKLWGQQLLELAQSQGVDAVLIAGDVFDRAVADTDTITLYDSLITAFAIEKIPVLVLAGNHDGAARLSVLHQLLADAKVFIAGTLRHPPQPVCFADTQIFLIPYFHPLQIARLYPDKKIRTAHDAMSALMQDICARHDKKKKLIVGAHCFVTGASPAESDYSAQLGGASQIGADAFAGADYVALGHLHRAQWITPNIYYSGSPYPYAFSEGGNSVAILDTQTGEHTLHALSPARVPRQIKGNYEEILSMDIPIQDYLKIELLDRPAGLEALEALRAKFPNLRMLSGQMPEVGQAQALTIDRLAALSPAELLSCFCEEMGSITPEAYQIEGFLQALRQVQEEGSQ